MTERLTSKGKRLLLKKEIELNKQLVSKTLEYGKAAGFGDGDGYHDETANMLEGEVRKAKSLLTAVRTLLENSRELDPPKHFSQVELGHRVGVELLDDEDVQGLAHVTILSSGDAMVLTEKFDQISEILVSEKSPLGRTLLEKRVGDEARYGINRVLVRSIGLAEVFRDE